MKRRSDLSPPLGFPGGPCYVVDRIEDEVESERLQDELQDKVERGESLTNPEASKVYDIEKDRGVGLIKSMRITAHAQYRMDLRSITVQEIRLFLSRFLRYVEAQKSKKVPSPQFVKLTETLSYGREVRWTESKMGLTVVFSIRNMEATIVTAYWEAISEPRSPASCRRRAYSNPDSEFSTYTRIVDRGSPEESPDTAVPYHVGPVYMGPAHTNKPEVEYGASPGRSSIPGEQTQRTVEWQPYPTKNRYATELIQTFGPSTFDTDFLGYPSNENPNIKLDIFDPDVSDNTSDLFKYPAVPSNGSGKVIPYDADYANNKTAAKAGTIIDGIDPKIAEKAKNIQPKLVRVDKKNARWTFKVPGSKESYTVKVKMLPGRASSFRNADIEVSCTCKDWVYGGPEYHAKSGGYLLGNPRGTASKPDVRDPNLNRKVCKHVAAVFTKAEKYSMSRKAAYFTPEIFDRYIDFDECLNTFKKVFSRGSIQSNPRTEYIAASYGNNPSIRVVSTVQTYGNRVVIDVSLEFAGTGHVDIDSVSSIHTFEYDGLRSYEVGIREAGKKITNICNDFSKVLNSVK